MIKSVCLNKWYVWSIIVLIPLKCSAMVFDNRFLPLIQHPYMTNYDKLSHFAVYGFAATGDKAFGRSDSDLGIPELFGQYNLIDFFHGLDVRGIPNPLPPDFVAKLSADDKAKILWNVDGRIQAQGFTFSYQQQIKSWLAAGFFWGFMRVSSGQLFRLDSGSLINQLDAGEFNELMRGRRLVQQALGLCGDFWTAAGMGDLDFYLRFGGQRDYVYKLRNLLAGVRIGCLAPTGVRRSINNPSSIPFGGNGHWGVYMSIDAEAELKEDWKIGFLFRVSKRFARTSLQRLPIGNEPVIFGSEVGYAQVLPGVTFNFLPYATFENVRGGFGGRLAFTMTAHMQDIWKDRRCDRSIPVNLCSITNFSDWASSYVTLTAFYDFGKVKIDRGFAPILVFNWDLPASFLLRYNSSKTQMVSMGLEYNF